MAVNGRLETPQENLSVFVQEACLRYGIAFTPKLEEEELTKDEQIRIKEITFPSELKLAVKVDLEGSKRAFLNLLDGWDEGEGPLWTFQDVTPGEVATQVKA